MPDQGSRPDGLPLTVYPVTAASAATTPFVSSFR
jgi:hypothetical protein